MVTGGASGLGEGTVKMILRLGGNAAIFDRDVKRGEGLVKELEEGGAEGKVMFCAVDVMNEGPLFLFLSLFCL